MAENGKVSISRQRWKLLAQVELSHVDNANKLIPLKFQTLFFQCYLEVKRLQSSESKTYTSTCIVYRYSIFQLHYCSQGHIILSVCSLNDQNNECILLLQVTASRNVSA